MKFSKPFLLPAVLLSLIATLGFAIEHPTEIAPQPLPVPPVADAVTQPTRDPVIATPEIQPPSAPVAQAANLVSHAVAALPLTTLTATDDFFAMVAGAPGIVLVDFYADWCGPCRTQSGILHQMQPFAAEQGASVIKVNVDQHSHLARTFQISTVPTLLLVKNGRIIERRTGVADHQRLAAMLSR